jgi:hypothetical protein
VSFEERIDELRAGSLALRAAINRRNLTGARTASGNGRWTQTYSRDGSQLAHSSMTPRLLIPEPSHYKESSYAGGSKVTMSALLAVMETFEYLGRTRIVFSASPIRIRLI